MHMISKKDLNSAESETLTTPRSPTIVITANGEVQTHEEATVFVRELNIFLTMKVLENTPAVLSLGKLCDENGYSCEWINGKKPHLIKNGIRIQCNTENFVPIVAAGLSTTPSSSSTSTSMTSSTVSSDSVTRQARRRTVSSKQVERQVRGDQCSSGTPEEELLTKPTKIQKQIQTRTAVWNGGLLQFWHTGMAARVQRKSCVLLMNHLQSPRLRELRIWVNTVFILTSLKTEIARSARGPQLQGPRAEDALAEPYLVLKILVTW